MTLRSLPLDDRRYQDLVAAAIARAKQTCPEWTDFSPSDPGRALIEVFAYLTEVMLYRLNRLPEKVYVELLRLIGVHLEPPCAAVTTLRFSLKEPRPRPVEIPRGTQVAAERAAADGEPPAFVTAETARIEAGATSVDVRAYHCEWIEAELLGTASGFPGGVVSVKRTPIVAPTGDGLDLVVGVEATAQELEDGAPVRRHEERAYRIWSERKSFSDLGDEKHVCVVDRSSGVITFAPALRERAPDGTGLGDRMAALAEIPAEGRQIRAWYRTGGGTAGNVAAGTLTKLKTPVPGVALEVTNPSEATGGRSGESLEHALRRGPQELHSLRRAITATDFETLALHSSGGIGRAHAYTKFSLWRHAPRGTVEVICVPHVPTERHGDGPLTHEILKAHETTEALDQVSRALEEKRPIGTHLLVRWGSYKAVRVKCRATVYRQEDAQAVRQRLLKRLYATLSPAAQADGEGWDFGQPLRAYDVYRILTSEPGVKAVAPIELHVDEVPSAGISALGADGFQPRTWYAASGDAVYRTLDDGEGWEQIARIEGARVKFLAAYPLEAAGARSRAGLVAAITEFADGKSRVYLSRDCGESWQEIGSRPEFSIEDIAWTDRDGQPALLLATERGLYELATRADADPVGILVDPERVDLGFQAVAVSTDVFGKTCVAVAAQSRGGVYLSTEGGAPRTFRSIGLVDEKLGVLAVQHRGAERFLWAGIEAAGTDPGSGCVRWQLPDSPERWKKFDQGWQAGGCRSLAFVDSKVLAGTRRHGVLALAIDTSAPRWSEPKVTSGLPMEDLSRMHAVEHIGASAVDAAGSPQGTVLAAGPKGIYRSRDQGSVYELSSRTTFTDRVTLPPTWLFCSKEHDIEVSTDESR